MGIGDIKRQEMITNMQKSLKVIRQICNLSAQELGEYIGVTRQTINNIENFKTSMSATHYIAICTLLDKYIKKDPKLKMHIMIVLQGNLNNMMDVGEGILNNSFYDKSNSSTFLDEWFLSFNDKADSIEIVDRMIFSENDLNILAKNYKIFVNADILEHINAKEFFKRFAKILEANNNKLIVPLSVVKYLQDNMLSTNTTTCISAKRALNILSKIQQKGLLDIRGESEDNIISNIFKSVFYMHRKNYRLALLTQDVELSKEIREFNKDNTEGFEIITAYMNNNSEIIPFKDLNYSEQNLNQEKQEKNDIISLTSGNFDGWDVIE